MRLAVLAHNLRVGGGLVVGRNITEVLPRLAPKHELLITVPAGLGYETIAQYPNVRLMQAANSSIANRARLENLELPKVVHQFEPDWVWALGNVPLKNPGCKQALLVYDPHMFYPRSHYALETWRNRLQKSVLRRHIARSLTAVNLVFCQTATARRRFIDAFGFRRRVEVLPAAVSEFATRLTQTSIPRPLAPFGDRFKLFFLTRYYAHKNIERIIEMYDRFRAELRNTLCILTIDASQHPRAGEALRAISRLGLDDLILNVGPLCQEQLADYYAACDAVLHPSLLESFSSSYLEAMHFGRPILASDLDFAHDVCGDAALYFNPWSIEHMKRTILQLSEDSRLRTELVEKSRRRMASSFRSWPEIVGEALDCLGMGDGRKPESLVEAV